MNIIIRYNLKGEIFKDVVGVIYMFVTSILLSFSDHVWRYWGRLRVISVICNKFIVQTCSLPYLMTLIWSRLPIHSSYPFSEHNKQIFHIVNNWFILELPDIMYWFFNHITCSLYLNYNINIVCLNISLRIHTLFNETYNLEVNDIVTFEMSKLPNCRTKQVVQTWKDWETDSVIRGDIWCRFLLYRIYHK